MITLELNGIEHDGFTSIEITRTVKAISGSYSFGITSEGTVDLPVRKGQSCRVLIGDTPVINGFIERISTSYAGTEHSISLAGRDKTADVIDSSALINEVTANTSLKGLIQQALSANDISDISVTNNVSGLANFGSGDTESAESGETIFSFISKYAKKRNVLLTTDGNGNIVITRAGSTQAETSLINVINGETNNILSASATYNTTQLFNKYTVRSQQNPVALWKDKAGSQTEAIEDQSGDTTDSEIRETRILEVAQQQTGSSEDAKGLAEWTKTVRQAASFKYVATVQGFHQDEDKTRLWVPNELVSVKDDFVDLTGPLEGALLIDKVVYNYTLDGGSTTTLTCVGEDSYKEEVIIGGALKKATAEWDKQRLQDA